ncbi:conserved hypothetical protein [Mucor ambiguus]|uniref:RNA polymerase sigma-70 region 4 domain-containing protein n=1 Tax=Mucor ambiguus TaxID=91626 RepID=A0A0C9N4R1_9FUNG|nr:conserved hypothetical protein [Mucor ambiguus]
MNQDKVVEMLKNYRSYKFAISNGIAGYDPYDNTGMPRGGGYGSREPRLGGGSTLQSEMDYRHYTQIVRVIDAAVHELLDDNQRTVIQRKYMDRNRQTLEQIAEYVDKDARTIRRWHKSALKELSIAFALIDVPEILNLDDVVLRTA